VGFETGAALTDYSGGSTWDDSPAEHSMSLYVSTRDGAGAISFRWQFNAPGHFIPNLDSTYDIGSTSVAVANIYTDKLSSITGNDLALNAVTGQQIAFQVNDVTEGTLSATATNFSGTTLAWGGGSAISSSDNIISLPMTNDNWLTWDDGASGETAINVLKVDTNDDTILNADTGDQIKFQIGGSDVGNIGTGGGLNWTGGRIMTQIDGDSEHWGMEETGGASVNSPRYVWKYSADTPGRAYMIGWDGSASDNLMRFEMINDASVIEMLPFSGGSFKFGDPPTTEQAYPFQVFGGGMNVQTDNDEWLGLEVTHNDDASGNWCGLGVTTHESSSNVSIPMMWLLKAHGTYTSPAATEASDMLGYFDYGGWAPTASYGAVGARIAAQAAPGLGNWANADTPADLLFYTTPNNSGTPVEHMAIYSTGYVAMHNTGYMGLSIINKDNSVSGNAELYVEAYGDNGVPAIVMYHPFGTYGSPSATGTGEWLGYLDFAGYGSAYATGARIYASTTQAWTGSAHGTTMVIQTKASGSTSLTTRMTINANGNVVFGDGVATTVRDAVFTVLRDDAGELLDLTTYGYGPKIDIQRAGGTEGSPTAIPAFAGSNIRFKYWDGSTWTVGAQITGATTQAWTDDSTDQHGARLQFDTTDNDAGQSLTTRWFIQEDGHFEPNGNKTYDIGNTSWAVRDFFVEDIRLGSGTYLTLDTSGIKVSKTQYNTIKDIGAQSGDFNVNWQDGNHQFVTLTNSSTQDVTFSNTMAGGIVTLVIRRSSNSGSLTWLQSSGQTASVDWGAAGAPTIPTTSGDAIVLTFIAHSATEIIGIINGEDFTLADI
jgi:hypothetical protein